LNVGSNVGSTALASSSVSSVVGVPGREGLLFTATVGAVVSLSTAVVGVPGKEGLLFDVGRRVGLAVSSPSTVTGFTTLLEVGLNVLSDVDAVVGAAVTTLLDGVVKSTLEGESLEDVGLTGITELLKDVGEGDVLVVTVVVDEVVSVVVYTVLNPLAPTDVTLSVGSVDGFLVDFFSTLSPLTLL